jgi:hypothetical protein
VLDHALEQIQAGPDIVAEIKKRPLHRLANQRSGCEVHHSIGTMIAESSINLCPIREIAFHKNGRGMHRRTVALGKIVEYDNGLTCGDQLFDDHAADVASSAGDQDFHEFLSLK